MVVQIWDDRRLILPTSYFTSKPFQNWTRTEAAVLGTAEFDVDWAVPGAGHAGGAAPPRRGHRAVGRPGLRAPGHRRHRRDGQGRARWSAPPTRAACGTCAAWSASTWSPGSGTTARPRMPRMRTELGDSTSNLPWQWVQPRRPARRRLRRPRRPTTPGSSAAATTATPAARPSSAPKNARRERPPLTALALRPRPRTAPVRRASPSRRRPRVPRRGPAERPGARGVAAGAEVRSGLRWGMCCRTSRRDRGAAPRLPARRRGQRGGELLRRALGLTGGDSGHTAR